jgi:diguanylate cyclase (GGDEF)-like protein
VHWVTPRRAATREAPVKPLCKRAENSDNDRLLGRRFRLGMIEPVQLSPLPHTASFLNHEDEADGAPLSGRPGQDAIPTSEFEAAQHQGFFTLRFSPALEAHFQADKAAERLQLLHVGILMSVILSAGMLGPDWLMVPDRFGQAIQLRLQLFGPFLAFTAFLLPRIPVVWREWVGVLNSLLAASIIVKLCLSSEDVLGPPYLVSLSLILLYNGGVVRTRFWQSLLIDILILLMFGLAVQSLPNPNVPVMVGVALIMVSTTVFTLYGSYWQEHEERTNWLMLKHEHTLMDKLESGNQRMDELTRFDPLTEIANRRHFDEFLEQVWSRAQQGDRDVALLMMDIDHFKRYNDHYGHPVGDACLKEVAATLGRHLRKPGDLVARFGGEEFIAVLSQTSLPDATTVAERVREAIWQLQRPHEASATQDRVTLSIGVASLPANAPDASIARLLQQADAALYQAKSEGRNRVCAAAQAC